MTNTNRIKGLKELIELLDESAAHAERIKAAYFDDSTEPGRNEGWHLVDDLSSLKRRLALELTDEQEDE